MEEIIKCKRCHRKLKDKKAREIGYGRVCSNKILQSLLDEDI